jgi:glycerophosphoryl diester phosphodiesterase
MLTSAFMVIAHRGASSYAPENTLAAFDLALRMGVHQIELDVQSTRDGHIIVMHDDTLNRTTDASGPVATHTLAALRELDAGSWFGSAFSGERIPTYEEVLMRYKGRMHIHTEIKGRTPSLPQRTADLIRRHAMEDQVTFTSFQKMRLMEIRAYAPELRTGWLVIEPTGAIIAEARALGFNQICPKAETLTPQTVRSLHDNGFIVRAWGAATEQHMRQAVQAGADGMTVNCPDRLIAYLNSRACPWM